MSFPGSLVGSSFLSLVGGVLLQSVAQGALVALLLACVLRLLRRQSANARYVAACGALLLMLALPVWTLARSASHPASGEAALGAQRAPVAGSSRALVFEDLALPVPATASQVLASLRALAERVTPWLVLGWLAGVLTLSLRFCGGWLLVRRLERIGTRMVPSGWSEVVSRMAVAAGIRRKIRTMESALVHIPLVIGWFRPLILLPSAALTGLTPQQLEAILAHELAHIRRHDYWMNLVQAAAEILLFYHPAVWWVSNRIRVEREHCCDDMGVAVCGDPLTYARALLVMEELRSVSRPPRLALALDGSALFQRVRRLLEPAPSAHGEPARWLAGLSMAVLVLAAILQNGISWAGAAPRPSAASASPAPPAPGVEKDRVAALTDEDVTVLVQRGLDRGLVEELRRSGDRALSLEEIRSWQDRGVSPKLLDELGALGLSSLTVDQLLNLVWYKVDGPFIQGVRDLGYKALSADDLIMLGRYGADAGFISGFQRLGYRDLSVDQLAMLGRYQVDGAFAESFQKLGYGNLSVDDLTLLRRYEVDGKYVEELGAAGYRNLPVDDLVSLRRYNVNGEMLRKIPSAGGSKPSVAEVLEAARYGRLN
jgi:beta-lactamase regulating signal transducer with metallopeptidase domain